MVDMEAPLTTTTTAAATTSSKRPSRSTYSNSDEDDSIVIFNNTNNNNNDNDNDDRLSVVSSQEDEDELWRMVVDLEDNHNNKNRYLSPKQQAKKQQKQKQSQAAATDPPIAAAETRAVYYSKWLVFVLLMMITVTVAVLIHYYLSQQEENDFTSQFHTDAQKVLQGVGTSLALTLGATDNFMLQLISWAEHANMTWPFVTVPDFAIKAAKLRLASQSVLVSCYPIVTYEQRRDWEDYTTQYGDEWVEEGLQLQNTDPSFSELNLTNHTTAWTSYSIIHNSKGLPSPGPGPFFPTWMSGPVVPMYYSPYNWDLYSVFSHEMNEMMQHHTVVIGRTSNLPDLNDKADVKEQTRTADWISGFVTPDQDPTEPLVSFYYPILNHANHAVSLHDSQKYPVVGVIAITLFWRRLLRNLLPVESDGIVIVIQNECNQSFSYQIMGPHVQYLGRGDRHDPHYDALVESSRLLDLEAFTLSDRSYPGVPLSDGFCPYSIQAYPSNLMKADYTTRNPVLFTMAAVVIFVLTSLVFVVYDIINEYRQRKVMQTAVQATAIVSSLFPSVIRDRLLPPDNNNHSNSNSKHHLQSSTLMNISTPKLRLQRFLRDNSNDGCDGGNNSKHNNNGLDISDHPDKVDVKASLQEIKNDKTKPIAELFPETTVLFADIAGFTAWSSVREPGQVFTLLETLYGAFDAMARRRGVFKVETIGDSYVAVTGLPDPQPTHAVIMARFARDCRNAMVQLVRALETTLGPGTGDLQLRVGLNSGPVTAGVLRGEKSRFQLFGDTVNTAARMESTGIKGKIQVSQSTADLLVVAGKTAWVTQREEMVEAKGKGKMQTYWVEPKSASPSPARKNHKAVLAQPESPMEESMLGTLLTGDSVTSRLVSWNVDVFVHLLRQIVAHRQAMGHAKRSRFRNKHSAVSPDAKYKSRDHIVLDEVKEIIELPEFDPHVARRQKKADSIELDPIVLQELESFIMAVATMYNPNPFHNFEHASHVTMSVLKLLNRIIAPDSAFEETRDSGGTKNIASTLHDHTYGITSDPLTQFACLFSALIHDVDHPGVPNGQLILENSRLAAAYKNKSIAEQNSVDLAWNLLMEDSFIHLRTTICADEQEMMHFRELVVNMVMATDIMDKDLKALRNARWDKAFSDNKTSAKSDTTSPRDAINRKATIVLEHLIQASDVAHTMQHWHIYCRWNERLFEEMYIAYLDGRSTVNPAENWYKGEIGFLDFYVIPLAKKLRDCGVFGVSSDEYLNYAMKNREEWESKGQEVVAAMMEKVAAKRVGI